jgi:hypothetical protein
MPAQLFYESVQVAPPPAAVQAPAVPHGQDFLEDLNDTFWDGIGGLSNGQSPFR